MIISYLSVRAAPDVSGLHAPVDHGPGPVLVTARPLRHLPPLVQRLPVSELLCHGRGHRSRGGQELHIVLLGQQSLTLLVSVVPKLWRRLIDRRLDILEHRHVIVVIVVQVLEDLCQVWSVSKEVSSLWFWPQLRGQGRMMSRS